MNTVKHLFLDTQDKNTGTTNYLPEFSLDVGKNLQGHFKIGLKSCVIPNLVYPITSQNNTFVFAEGGGANIVSTLTVQNYTGSELATELQTVLNADGALTYVVAYDSQTGKLTVAPTSSTVQFKTTHASFTAGFVLGFDTTSDTVDASSITTSYPVRLDGSMYVDIEMAGASTKSITSKNTSSPFVRIPLTSSFGSIISYENTDISDNLLPIDASSLSNLRLRLRDDTGANWVLPNTAYCSFVFNLYNF